MKETKNKRLNPIVFWPPFLLLLGAVIYSFIDSGGFAAAMNKTYEWLGLKFGWLFLLIGLFIIVLLAVIFCSKAGSIRFGGKDAKPKYGFWNWFAMSLCGGIAIGIVFWGVAEPITFLATPNNGIEPFSGEAVRFAMSQSYFHWTLIPYGMYALATIPIALAVYNYGQKMTISSGLYFLLGDRCNGVFGNIVNAVSLFALVGGISTSLGFGLMQIGSGVSYTTGITPSPFLWAIIAALIIGAFLTSSMLGIDKGIKWLSDQNLKLYIIVLVFLFIVGPSVYILNLGVESTGAFVTTFFEKATYLGTYNGEDWSRWWTVFYWAVWFAYAPVVGIFLTRLCYGRTIRQFLAVNLIAPSVFCMIWFTIFGGTAIDMQLSGTFDLWNALQTTGTESAVYAFFSQLPLGNILIIVFLIVICTSFVTMADSMTYVAAVMSTSGFHHEEEPPQFLKLTWGIIMGVLAWVMISFAGLDGARMLATISAFPILFLMILLLFAAIKGLFATEIRVNLKNHGKRKKETVPTENDTI